MNLDSVYGNGNPNREKFFLEMTLMNHDFTSQLIQLEAHAKSWTEMNVHAYTIPT